MHDYFDFIEYVTLLLSDDYCFQEHIIRKTMVSCAFKVVLVHARASSLIERECFFWDQVYWF